MFKIEKSKLAGIKGKLFLKGEVHCHTKNSVENLLKSKIFKNNNKELVPIFEKALDKMNKKEIGIIKIN